MSDTDLLKNVLRIVLLIVGLLLVGYGLYSFFTPEVIMQAGPLKVEAQGDKTQSYAMIGLGILALIGGIAFKKR
jgi:hypothetical protein